MKATRQDTIRVAIQKSGRLSEKSLSIFEKCGIEADRRRDQLIVAAHDFPVEFMFVRDDDIPGYLRDEVCDLGVVGRNVVCEKQYADRVAEIRAFDFGHCRLAIAVSDGASSNSVQDLANRRIATSYPCLLARFLKEQSINCEILEISGSVEIAPALGIADAICDLVSTGATLRANGLREITTILRSQAILIAPCSKPTRAKEALLQKLMQRLDGVMKAQKNKYIMMNASIDRIEDIKKILPGMEDPTIVPLTTPGKVAIHTVASENIFWETMERLKAVGATSILVAPIEKAFD